MGYIYYIWLPTSKQLDLSSPSTGNYIGQGTDNNYERMLRHLRIAYGTQNGPVYGSELLLQKYGAGSVLFGVYEDDNYGLGATVFQQMAQAGWDLTTPAAKLDAAEIIHIITHNGDLSNGNVAVGGQGHLTWQWTNAKWIQNFKTYFPTISSTVLQKIQAVKINWHDDKTLYERKLFKPDEYLVLRAASFAIEESILFNTQLLKSLIKAYLTNGNISSLIAQQVQNTINILNQHVFQQNVLTSANVNLFASIVEDKVLKWICQRLQVATIDSLQKGLGPQVKIIDYMIHGVPNKNGTQNSGIAYKLQLHIKRHDWVQIIPTAQPQWYRTAMQNITPPPHINTKYKGSALYDAVEECVYSIFKIHLAACAKNVPSTAIKTFIDMTNPSLTINMLEPISPRMLDKMRVSYAQFRSADSMHYFDIFYKYAMSRWQRERSHSLQVVANQSEEWRYYTFEPAMSDTTWVYNWSQTFEGYIEDFFQASDIPSYTW